VYARLKKMGVTGLDSPVEYPYFEGCYPVYFADRDGIKIEFVRWQKPLRPATRLTNLS
jgi:hypothetical protein